ncbi:hypothetical protein B0J15DRAFT_475342 [Fusarium solani]|uniref:Uncharacterized protein n=1 Tax=Fusarium solani TaxID=169388 RepID=A0A9P9RE24_FUSSL|nr:uncharacterized protein B0J15DRAFT_475342 [Fusarium solani]KAH7275572.1 hypothetical protein B0J15DRAFT_475342 [Fusarium solani]
MPTYLCHGFRWHRRAIRIYVILNDLEDAASNWIIGPATSSSIVSQFYTSYDFLPEVAPPQQEASVSIKAKKDIEHLDDDLSLPPSRVPPEHDGVLMHSWSAVKLLEEFDPEETMTPCRPYAYVADYVVRVDLSVDVAGEMAKYYEKMAGEDGWIVKLRDELQKGEPVRWYVVVCGDEVRDFPGASDDEESEEDSTSEYGVEGEDTLTVLDDIPEEQEGRSTPRPPEQEWPDIRQPIQPSEPLPQRLSTSTTSSSQWSQEDAAAPPRLTPDLEIPLLRTFDSVSSRYSTSTASGLYHDGDRLLLEPEEFVMAQSPARTPLREEAPDIVMPIRAEELNPSLSAWSTTPSPQHTELPDSGSHLYAETMPSRSPSLMSPATVRQEKTGRGPVEVHEPEKTQPHQTPSPMTQSSPWQQLLGSRLQHSDDGSSSGRSSPIAPQKGGSESLHDPRDFQSSQTPSPTSPNPPWPEVIRPLNTAQDTRLSLTPSPTSPNPPMSNATRSLHDPPEIQSSLIPAPLSPKPLQPGLKSSLINLKHLQSSRTPSPTSPTSLDSPQSSVTWPLINPKALHPSQTPSPTSPNPPTRSLINAQDLQPSRTPSPPSPTSLGPSQTRQLINPQHLRSQTPSPTSPTSLGASQTRSLINPQDLRSSETPSPTSPSPLKPVILRSLINPQDVRSSQTPSPTSHSPLPLGITRSLVKPQEPQPSRTPSPTSRNLPTGSLINPHNLQPSRTPSPTSRGPPQPEITRSLINPQDLRPSQTPSPSSPEPLQPVSTKSHIDPHYLRASQTPSPTSPSPLPPGPRSPERPQNTRYSETPSPTSPNPPQQGVARGLNPADIQPSQTPSPTSPYPPQASRQPLDYFQNQHSRTPSPPSPDLSYGLLGSSFHSALQAQPQTPLSTSPNPAAGQGLLGSALPRPGEAVPSRTPSPMLMNPSIQDLPTPDISRMPGALPLSPSTPIPDPFQMAEIHGAQERDTVSGPSSRLTTPTLVQKETPDPHTVDHSTEPLLQSPSPASPVRRPQETPIPDVPPPPEPVEVIRVPPPTPPKARSVQEEEIGAMSRSERGEPSGAGAAIRAPPPARMAFQAETSSFVDELENEETVWEPRPSPASNHGWDRGPQHTPLGNGEGRAPPVPPPPPPPPPTQIGTRQVNVSTQHTEVHKPEGEQQRRQARRRHSVADGLKRLFRKGHNQNGSH